MTLCRIAWASSPVKPHGTLKYSCSSSQRCFNSTIRINRFSKEKVFAWMEFHGLSLIFSQTSINLLSTTCRRVSVITCGSSAEYHTRIIIGTASSSSRLNATHSKMMLRATAMKLISLMTSVHRPSYPSKRPCVADLTMFRISLDAANSKFML